MKAQKKRYWFFFFLILNFNTAAIAQTLDSSSVNAVPSGSPKKFVLGLYIGSLIANQSTASLYDGYGFDIDGNKYDFSNSWMNQKINYQYGGQLSSTYQDQIAEQLNVTPGSGAWSFSEADMPTNMRYAPAFNIGLNTKYSVDKHNAIIMNVNAAKLLIRGNFIINVQPSQQASTTQMNNTGVQTFSIIGGEQRLILMFGYQHLFGEDDAKFAPFIEAGLVGTATKFDKNFVIINNLTIDLLAYNNSYYNNAMPVKKPIGMGFGAFGGLGINIKTNTKYSAQVVYNPSMEKINIGANPQLNLQNSIGLRFFYNF